ncbi:MAG: hypothetical protein EOO41_03585 [Methanobacteriota archaeon]|nr:MAG: hypothetical protein EOO41_03585 [Euryarchaeota archaeon]
MAASCCAFAASVWHASCAIFFPSLLSLSCAAWGAQNREIRNVLEHFGLTVNRLMRVSYGPFDLKGIPRGSAREERIPRWLLERAGAAGSQLK